MKLDMSKVTRAIHTSGKVVQKNSPLLLTIAGVVGLGVTAYLAYKSAGKVADITNDLEDRRAKESAILELQNAEGDLSEEDADQLEALEQDYTPIKRSEVVRDIAGAVAAPVLTGALSICSIALSYYILNNRVLNLAASLATATAQNAYFEKKFKKDYGNDEYKKFTSPEMQEVETTGDDGKKHINHITLKDLNLNGEFFDHSTEYASDDYAYNIQWIKSKTQILQDKLGRNGFLLLNEVRDELGFERTRDGALMGWSISDRENFDIYIQDMQCTVPTTGELKRIPYVKWTRPVYIYDDITYKDILGYAR